MHLPLNENNFLKFIVQYARNGREFCFGKSLITYADHPCDLYIYIYICAALGFWYGNTLVQSGEMSPGSVVTVFFSVVFAAFAIGQGSSSLPAFAEGLSVHPTHNWILPIGPILGSCLWICNLKHEDCVRVEQAVTVRNVQMYEGVPSQAHACMCAISHAPTAQGTAYGLFNIIDRETAIDSLDESGNMAGTAYFCFCHLWVLVPCVRKHDWLVE